MSQFSGAEKAISNIKFNVEIIPTLPAYAEAIWQVKLKIITAQDSAVTPFYYIITRLLTIWFSRITMLING